MNEEDLIVSRRKFLKNMAYGSLLLVGGISPVSAKVKAISAHTVIPVHGGAAKKLKPKVEQHPVVTRVHDTLHSRLFANKPSYGSTHRLAGTGIGSRRGPIAGKMLAFRNINTGDQLNVTYFEQGRYLNDALKEINHLFRDYHDGSVHPIDLALLDQLHDLRRALDCKKPFQIVSGYRSPATNADMRKHSDGVARNSLHMEGRAIDIRIEGLDTRRIRDAALAMQRGGVGYYGRSDFVHLDTGAIRTWLG